MKDSNFVLSSMSHALAISYYFAFTTVITQMIVVYDFTSNEASYLSSAF